MRKAASGQLAAFVVSDRSMFSQQWHRIPIGVCLSSRGMLMPDKVKCAACGFLAVQHTSTRELLSAEQITRETGDMIRAGAYENYLVCYALAYNLADETGHNPGTPERKIAANRERHCQKFVEWRGGSPKDHQDMLDRQWMIEQQDKRDEANRNFQVEQATLANKRYKEDSEIRHKHHIHSMILAIGGAIVLAIATLAAVRLNPQPNIIVTPNATAPTRSASDVPTQPDK
jgi:hypothetical protein